MTAPTNLGNALTELRQMDTLYGQLWTAREVMQTQNAGNCKTIATILNAVLSGDLIPRDLAALAADPMVMELIRDAVADALRAHGISDTKSGPGVR